MEVRKERDPVAVEGLRQAPYRDLHLLKDQVVRFERERIHRCAHRQGYGGSF